jgi:hypothetical protein
MRISVLLQPAEDLLLEDEGFPQRLKSAYQKHGLDPELDCHSIAAAVHKTHPGRYQFYMVHHKDDKDASMPWHTFMGDPKADKVFDGSGEMTGTHLAINTGLQKMIRYHELILELTLVLICTAGILSTVT